MAVQLEGTTRRYVGRSADAKPIYDGDTTRLVPPGSTFLESDTGKIYRFDGVAWMYATPSDESVQLLSALLVEMRTVRELVELMVK